MMSGEGGIMRVCEWTNQVAGGGWCIGGGGGRPGNYLQVTGCGVVCCNMLGNSWMGRAHSAPIP